MSMQYIHAISVKKFQREVEHAPPPFPDMSMVHLLHGIQMYDIVSAFVVTKYCNLKQKKTYFSNEATKQETSLVLLTKKFNKALWAIFHM